MHRPASALVADQVVCLSLHCWYHVQMHGLLPLSWLIKWSACTGEQLDKSQFCELLSRCAILWCDVDEHSEVIQVLL